MYISIPLSILLLFTSLSFPSFCQIEGPITPSTAVVNRYTFDPGKTEASGTHWVVTNGMVKDSIINGTQRTAIVQWKKIGPGTISIYNGNEEVSSLKVSACDIIPDTLKGGGEYCTGQKGPAIKLSHSKKELSYQLKLNNKDIGPASTGTGSTINWENQTVEGDYVVVVTSSKSNCSITMPGKVSVKLKPLPSVSGIGGGGSSCFNSSHEIVLHNWEQGVDYQLKVDGKNFGASLRGLNGPIVWHNINTSGTYSVEAKSNSTGCANKMPGEVRITNDLPNHSISGGGDLTSSTEVNIVMNGSTKDVSYQLKLNGSNVGEPVAGNGKSLTWHLLKHAGLYTITATNSKCSQPMPGNVMVTGKK